MRPRLPEPASLKGAESERDDLMHAPYEDPYGEDAEVRIAVAEAIEQLSGSELATLETDELLRRTDDPDPEVRLRAAMVLEPEEEGLNRLVDLLANDPDPRVRAAATVSLENSELFGAMEALLAALNDPNPEVVVEVIDSLEFAGDASTIRHLEPLLAHEDSSVREAASGAIAFLED
jgi:HEAT repeat protein